MAILCKECFRGAMGPHVPTPAARVSTKPCQNCNGFDKINGKEIKRNFIYPDRFLPSNPDNPNVQAAKEEEAAGNPVPASKQ